MALNTQTAVKCIIIWCNKAKTPKLKIVFSLYACSISTHHSALYTWKAQSTAAYKQVSVEEVQCKRDQGRLHLVSQTKSKFCIGQEQHMGWLSGLAQQEGSVLNMDAWREPDILFQNGIPFIPMKDVCRGVPKNLLLYPTNLKQHHWFLDKCNASQIMFVINIIKKLLLWKQSQDV